MRNFKQRQFFTNDLYLDEGEPGNALWGYQLGNNFGRILGIQGSVAMKAQTVPGFVSVGQTNEISFTYNRDNQSFVDIPVKNLSLQHAPVVELWAGISHVTITSTVYIPTRWNYSGRHSLTTPLYGGNEVLIYLEDFPDDLTLDTDLNNGDGTLTFGNSSEEVMYCAPNNWFKYTYSDHAEYHLFVTRGWAGSPILEYGTGVPWSVNQAYGVNIGQTVTNNPAGFYHNPPFVEAYLDSEKLRIRWMYDSDGVVYYRIFGA